MVVVSEATRQAWEKDSSHKEVKLFFPSLNLTYTNENIIEDSLTITEGLMADENMEFYGCFSSSMSIQIVDAYGGLKGQKVIVSVSADNTQEINLFTGYIDSCEKTNDRRISTLKAYDVLYTLSDTDVAAWYKGLTFPMTVGQLRESLFKRIGIDEYLFDLPINDNLIIYKEYDPNELNALDVIKQICQLNGVCGIINRDGFFEYRYIDTSTVRAEYDAYKSIVYEDWMVLPISQVTLRNTEEDAGTSYGGGNRYVVQGNMFVFGNHEIPEERPQNLPEKDESGNDIEYITALSKVAENVFQNVSTHTYKPYEATLPAKPYIEVGDLIKISKIPVYSTANHSYYHGHIDTMVIRRTIKGIQNMTDTFVAEGVENQRVFISDLGLKVPLVKNDEDLTELKEQVNKNTSDIGTNKTDISTNKTDIATNKTDIENQKKTIEEQKKTIEEQTKKIGELEAELDEIRKGHFLKIVSWDADHAILRTEEYKPKDTNNEN